MDIKEAKKIIQRYESGGHFKNALLKAVRLADKENLNNLYYAYPELVKAHCINIGLKYTDTSGAGIFFKD